MPQMHNKAKILEKVEAPSAIKTPTPHRLGTHAPAVVRSGFLSSVLRCLGIFLVALGFNLYQIGNPSLWFDEILSVTRAWQPLPVLWQIVSVTQPNMALYYVALHSWLSFMNLFGIYATEAVVRIPSAFFSALSTFVLYALARRFFREVIAAFVALLYLLNTLQLTSAQNARSYAFQLLFLSLAWYALVVLFSSDLSKKRERLWWFCFILSATLAIYLQLFTELMLATQALAIVLLCVVPTSWRARVRQQWRPLFISWVCIGILIAPLLYASRVGSKTGWLPTPHLKDVYHLFLTISGQNCLLLVLFGLTMGIGLCATLFAALPWGQDKLKQLALSPRDEVSGKEWQLHYLQLLPLAICLLCWLLCPVVISYLISQKATRLFSPRYLVVIVPAFVLLVGVGLSVLRWRTVQIMSGLCLVLLCLFSVPGYYNNAQVEDWRTGTQWLQQHYQPGDGLICYDNIQGCAVDIEYYLRAYPHSTARFDADSPGYFSWVSYDATNQAGDYIQALSISAIQRYATKHSRLFFGVGRVDPTDPSAQPTIQWLNAHYHLLTKEVTSTLTIYLYDTTSPST